MKSRRLLLALADTLCFVAVYLGIMLFFLYGFTVTTYNLWLNLAVLYACLTVSRLGMRVYRDILRYASTGEYLRIILADAMGGIGFLLVSHAFMANPMLLWHVISIVCITCLATIMMRLCYQTIRGRRMREGRTAPRVNVAIVGAGRVGALLASELELDRQHNYKPACFIDLDPQKVGSRIGGVRVLEENESVLALLREMSVDEIVIALPNLDIEKKRALYDKYQKTGLRVRIYDFPFGSENRGKRVLREINLEELLFRGEMELDRESVQPYYQGKTVMVTGGGGSIGAELCRQLAALSPKRLIIVDVYENNAYDIEQELRRRYGNALDLCVEIASVRDRERVDALFAAYWPEVVFHAAAHKHVPLMEHSCGEAVKNNVLGTVNVADAAEKYGVSKFILISTDKAVNPTNVMGASKRLCEMIALSRGDSATSFAAVRFGNVLGSNGSVVPLFRRQIEAGGPVTLTDKRIVRYFMTITEASRLVLTAGAMARRGELFVLDMGKPMYILELAENMIRMCGLTPYADIDIVETGLRPGEKLYEELLIQNEEMDHTPNAKIFIERDRPLTRAQVEQKLAVLREALASGGEADVVRDAFKRVVPTFRSPEEVNRAAEEAEEMKNARTTGMIA